MSETGMPSGTETAQDAYRRLVRDYLAPAFRSLGLLGSGNIYRLPDDHYWMSIGLQRSRHSDSRRVHFTLNMGFVSKAEWSEQRTFLGWASLPERPTPNIAAPVGLAWRIGAVLEPGETWWEVRPGQPLDALAQEITSIVRVGALPWLKSHVDDPLFYKSARDRTLIRPRLGRFPTDFHA